MSLLCHILNDIDNRHPPLPTISASPAASVQDLTQSSMGKEIVDTSFLPPLVRTPPVQTVTPIPILDKRKAIKRKAKDKDDHDDNVNLQMEECSR